MTPTEWELYAKTEILDRWPRWEPTLTEKEDWREQFSQCNPDWLREAIKQVRREYASDIPRMKWILAAFNDVAKRESAGQPRPVQPDPTEQNRPTNIENLARVDSEQLANAHEYCLMQHTKTAGNVGCDPLAWDSLLLQHVCWIINQSRITDKEGRSVHPAAVGIVQRGMTACGC